MNCVDKGRSVKIASVLKRDVNVIHHPPILMNSVQLESFVRIVSVCQKDVSVIPILKVQIVFVQVTWNALSASAYPLTAPVIQTILTPVPGESNALTASVWLRDVIVIQPGLPSAFQERFVR